MKSRHRVGGRPTQAYFAKAWVLPDITTHDLIEAVAGGSWVLPDIELAK